MEINYLYEKYTQTDIILCIYLEVNNTDLDSYNPFDFSNWEHNKFQEFKEKNGYPANKLYNKYLKFLLGNT